MSKRIIIITGMHRSGTSALAKVFVDMGFDAGNNLMLPDNDNPCGYWEDIDIFNLNEAILSKLFLTWDKIENFENRRLTYFKDEIYSIFGEQALQLIKAKLSASDQVLIKDPRFSILMPFWNNIFHKAEVPVEIFHIYRNPISVVGSLEKRNGISIHNGLLLWYYYNVTFYSDVQFPVNILSYHQLLSNPNKIFNKITETLSLSNLPKPFSDYTSSIQPDLDHNKIINDNPDINSFPFPEYSLLWSLLALVSETKSTGIANSEIAPFLIKKISDFLQPAALQRVVSTIYFKQSGNLSESKTLQASGFIGENELFFDISEGNVVCNDFEIYFFDRPCKVSLIKTLVELDSRSVTVDPDKGNFIVKRDDQYFFDENQPYLHFSLPEASIVKTVKLSIGINALQISDLELIASAHRINHQLSAFNLDQNYAMSQALSIDNSRLNNKIEKLEIQVEKYKSEIAALEKKSHWLYTEFNKAKNSLSWKITRPLRRFQAINHSIENKIFILKNDIGASYRLLLREGMMSFFNRLVWYLKGKRLKEDIESVKSGCRDQMQWKNHNHHFPNAIQLPKVVNPLVSIVIPMYNNLQLTANCVYSLVQNTDGVEYELIIADDHSTENGYDLSKMFGSARIVYNEKNVGFLKTCNRAAKHVRGKYICFLNNDTEVQPGWLKPLFDLLQADERIAIACPKLIYPDGRLQEAGGIIWNDASGWNFGKYDDPEKPDYNYTKEVDYISGACMVVRKKVWEELKGFDEQYAPAYYEDTDLAFGVRKLGYKVVYQPLSLVTHFEGASNGCDESTGLKRFQVINKKKFLDKWQHKLSVDCSPNGTNVFFHRDRSLNQKHLLVIDHYVPMYDNDAGSRSTFSYLKLFLKMGFKIHFIGDNYFRHEPYTTVLQQMGIEVLYGSYYQQNIRNWFRENGQYINFVIAHRVHIAPKYFDCIKKFTQAKLAYVGHDLQYLTCKRQFEITGNKVLKKKIEKFKKTETRIFNTADIILPFSTFEAPYIEAMAPDKIVQTIPVYFFNGQKKEVPGFDERKDILFVGYFGHPPNPDAIKWFVKDIFPLVQKSIPNVKLYIVGSHPTKEIKNLQSESIQVTGYVSDEKLESLYKSCRLTVLPLRFGAGVKGKLLESLYHGLPPVITSIAAEGVFDIEDHALIADKPADFAEKVHLLYTNQDEWEKYQKLGIELINTHYTEDAARRILEGIFEEALQQKTESDILV